MKRWWVIGLALLVPVGAISLLAYRQITVSGSRLAIGSEAAKDLYLDLPQLNPTEWVERYDPERCYNGYSLVLYRRELPLLIAMNGQIVHQWPQVRAIARAILTPDGRLAVIGRDDAIKEYDWEGELTWSFRFHDQDDLPHHDLTQLSNGNYLVLAQAMKSKTDILREVDRQGKVVWEWRADEHLDSHFKDRNPVHDPTHFNSVREIPPNQWFNGGDERFRPGNILVSARHLNTVLIIAKQSREIVWKYSQDLDFQHEAIMIPAGLPGAGNIVVFNNGNHNRQAYRQSSVVIIDPLATRTLQEYRAEGFFSSVAGTAQPLANGNLLISSSEGGRVFEVADDGAVVWQWQPPFLPMRATRYGPAHCPQLARIARLDRPTPVRPSNRHPFIDIELYALALPEECIRKMVNGRNWPVLSEWNLCRELTIPEQAMIRFNHGFDTAQSGKTRLQAEVTATIRALASDQTTTLIADRIDSHDDAPWRRHRLSLAYPALTQVELCLAAEVAGPQELARSAFILTNPRIFTKTKRIHRQARPHRRSPQQEEHERKQLEAIGYLQ